LTEFSSPLLWVIVGVFLGMVVAFAVSIYLLTKRIEIEESEEDDAE
jgi:hypothetical protein